MSRREAAQTVMLLCWWRARGGRVSDRSICRYQLTAALENAAESGPYSLRESTPEFRCDPLAGLPPGSSARLYWPLPVRRQRATTVTTRIQSPLQQRERRRLRRQVDGCACL